MSEWIKFKVDTLPDVYQEIYVSERNLDLLIKVGGKDYPENKFKLDFYTQLHSQKELKRLINLRLTPPSRYVCDEIYIKFVNWYKKVYEKWEEEWRREKEELEKQKEKMKQEIGEQERKAGNPATYAEKIMQSLESSEDKDIQEILISETEYYSFLSVVDKYKEFLKDYDENKLSRFVKFKVNNKEIPFVLDVLLDKFMDFEDENYKFLSIVWVLGTYVHQLFTHYPYLWINAPKSSGKTKLTKILTWSSYQGILTGGQSPSSIYYAVDKLHATIGVDEAEKLSNSERSIEINNILLAGFEKNLPIMRVPRKTDGTNDLREFKVYSPKIITNITGISNDALESRMIPLRLIRSNNPEKVNKNPFRSNKLFDFAQVLGCVWAYENWERVKEEYLSENEEEQVIVGRNYTLFKPLLSVCKIAFPDKYQSFLDYCKSLNKDILIDLSENTIEVMFLKTMKSVFEDVSNGLVESPKDDWFELKLIRSKFKEMFYPDREISIQWLSKRLNDGRRLLGFKKRTVRGNAQYQIPFDRFLKLYDVYVLDDNSKQSGLVSDFFGSPSDANPCKTDNTSVDVERVNNVLNVVEEKLLSPAEIKLRLLNFLNSLRGEKEVFDFCKREFGLSEEEVMVLINKLSVEGWITSPRNGFYLKVN